MHQRNLRNFLLAGTSRLIAFAADGDDDAGGAGGAPPAAAPAPEADPPAPAAGEGGDTGAAPAGDEPPAGLPAADAGADDAGQQKPARIPWQTKRIDALTAQAKQEREAREAAEAEVNATRARLAAYEALYGTDGDAAPAGGGSPPPPPPPAGGKVFTEADVQAEAQRIAGMQRLNEKCENLFKDGAAKHGTEWNTRVSAVGQAFGKDLQTRPDFFEALTSLPNGADVYNLLAADLDHFGEVLSMDGVKLGMELAQLSTKAGVKPKGPAVSEVPAPIDPVHGQGGGEEDLTRLSMDDFAKTREKQREERYKAKGYA